MSPAGSGIEKYDLADPVVDDTVGVFVHHDLQVLYDALIEQGTRSEEDALWVGCASEEIDMIDLQDAIDHAEHRDIARTYQNLMLGSENCAIRGQTTFSQDAPAPRPGPRAAGSRTVSRRVLVVDDQRDVADSLCQLLRALGAEAVYDGAAALTALDEHRPDLVLLDLGMPGMDGYEVAHRMREARPGKGLVIAAVTGWSDKQVGKKVLASGLDLHLTKPVTLDTLIAVLRERGG